MDDRDETIAQDAGGESSPAAADQQKDDDVLLPEKIQDEEEVLPLYIRVFYFLLPCLRHDEDYRRVWANDHIRHKPYKYANNYVKTSKYNIITFVPLNLFEQFLRVANFYFLILVILQAIPGISSVPFYSTLLPLVGVLGVTLVKDGFDDLLRHISDYKINTRPATVLRQGQRLIIRWKNVVVGDVLRLENNDFITADLLLLSSSEPNGLAYIETAELDGETNLKVRQPLPDTAVMKQDETQLSTFNGYVECEAPNNRLHKFVGTLHYNEQKYSLDNDQILLRGCRLRNTQWTYGLVIYAGHDTKLVKNSGRTKFKRTQIDLLMNKMVFAILGFLALLLCVCVIGSGIYEALYGQHFQVFVPYQFAVDDPAKIAFLQIISNLIVLNTFVPISLYVSVEVIRLGLSLLINWDTKMYYEPNDISAVAHTTTLNEELGQIEYIFSDKTGTLTQNIMTFLKCSINGTKYGDKREDGTKELPIDFTSWNSYAEKSFIYYDTTLLDSCSDDSSTEEFFKLLCLCHTVLPHKDEDGTLSYNAQSPDEAALVSAARNFGYVFKARTPFDITLELCKPGQSPTTVKFELLNILDFNNERKRMSVIVKEPSGKLMLYCKGADTIIFQRLAAKSSELMAKTQEHLNDYGKEGLRTLVLAKKELEEKEYQEWAAKYHDASVLSEGRDDAVDKVYSEIEQEMELVGATAIEDKLQDGVPDTIATLAKANIKIWVLTGDKQETAINIGYSSKLLTSDMKIFVLDKDDFEGVRQQLNEAKDEIERVMAASDDEQLGASDLEPTGPPFGIIINGHSLRYALRKELELLLLDTASLCQAVVCCRVTPLQKKRVVDLVKKNKKAVTLAIGDGANDVGMIKAAHIGVGISGQEGQQAVLASDYSFGQFRFLERLLLVHGRWSYHRMTLFLGYFFYKNFAFAFSQFLFAFFCGFTAQTLYDPAFITVYNVIYTSLPIVALAILDQDVNEAMCHKYPKLYIAGQKNKRFNVVTFILGLFKGIVAAFTIFFVLFGFTYLNVMSRGYEWDYQSVGNAASGALVVIVNLQVALEVNYWNPIIHFFVWLSILAWPIVTAFTSGVDGLYTVGAIDSYGVTNEVMAAGGFWFYWIVATIVTLFPVITFYVLSVELKPTLLDDVRLEQTNEWKQQVKDKFARKSYDIEQPTAPTEETTPEPPPQPEPPVVRETTPSSQLLRSRLLSIRSSYAFSHEPGFADLIMSGRWMGAREDQVKKQRMQRSNTWMCEETDRAPLLKDIPRDKSAPAVDSRPPNLSIRSKTMPISAEDEDIELKEWSNSPVDNM